MTMPSNIDSNGQRDKGEVARRLAESHRQMEPDITGIYRLTLPGREEDPQEPIKLLEINPNTTASGILPVGFSASPASGYYFPVVIVEIHPTEWPQLQSGQLQLPQGWQLGSPL